MENIRIKIPEDYGEIKFRVITLDRRYSNNFLSESYNLYKKELKELIQKIKNNLFLDNDIKE